MHAQSNVDGGTLACCSQDSMIRVLLQVKEVNGQEVTCVAQNDSLLDGLLTLIHQERTEEFGMSSFQVHSLHACCRWMHILHADIAGCYSMLILHVLMRTCLQVAY